MCPDWNELKKIGRVSQLACVLKVRDEWEWEVRGEWEWEVRGRCEWKVRGEWEWEVRVGARGR